jgi:cellulose synthase/poly-beta-1,6-N-acetylglucosamine synthase-like glycosyltransferase
MEKRIHSRWMNRPNKRIVLIALMVLSFLSLSLVILTRTVLGSTCGAAGRINKSINEAIAFSIDQASFGLKNNQDHAIFVDLNQLESKANGQDKVVILTPLKNAAPYLERYFELLEELKYPKHLISLAFLVSDTTDNTVEILRSYANNLLTRRNKYDSIIIYEKDFNFELPEDKRHSFDLQPLRRSFMARSRNYLLTAALRDDHAWVLWLDVDVVRYSDTILQDLQSLDVDVVVPNCLRETEDGSFWGYDKNNWQETDESRAIQENLEPVSDFFFFFNRVKTCILTFQII